MFFASTEAVSLKIYVSLSALYPSLGNIFTQHVKGATPRLQTLPRSITCRHMLLECVRFLLANHFTVLFAPCSPLRNNRIAVARFSNGESLFPTKFRRGFNVRVIGYILCITRQFVISGAKFSFDRAQDTQMVPFHMLPPPPPVSPPKKPITCKTLIKQHYVHRLDWFHTAMSNTFHRNLLGLHEKIQSRHNGSIFVETATVLKVKTSHYLYNVSVYTCGFFVFSLHFCRLTELDSPIFLFIFFSLI